MSVGWTRTSPVISSSSEPSGAQNKMDTTFSQLWGCLCQEVAPLIHVSSKDEGWPFVNLPSALKRILKTQACLAAAPKLIFKTMMLMCPWNFPLFCLLSAYQNCLPLGSPQYLGKRALAGATSPLWSFPLLRSKTADTKEHVPLNRTHNQPFTCYSNGTNGHLRWPLPNCCHVGEQRYNFAASDLWQWQGWRGPENVVS